MLTRKNQLFLIGVVAGALASTAAGNVIENVHEDFLSGAQFNGTVTFLDDFSNVSGVDGSLTGGIYGNDHIDWIWDPTNNFASSFGPQFGGNFLMDGTSCGAMCGSYTYFITFTWDSTNAPNLVISTPATDILSALGGNNINYDDPMVDGMINAPELASLALLGSALAALAFFMKRRRASVVGNLLNQ